MTISGKSLRLGWKPLKTIFEIWLFARSALTRLEVVKSKTCEFHTKLPELFFETSKTAIVYVQRLQSYWDFKWLPFLDHPVVLH